MNVAEETSTEYCQQKEKSALHVLRECEALARLRPVRSRKKEETLDAISYIKEPVAKLRSPTKKTKPDAEL